MRLIAIIVTILFTISSWASEKKEWLVKLNNSSNVRSFQAQQNARNLGIANWVKIEMTDEQMEILKQDPNVLAVEKNITLKIQLNNQIYDPVLKQQVVEYGMLNKIWQNAGLRAADNPAFPVSGSGGSGADTHFSKQWGMSDIGVTQAWNQSGTKGKDDVIVAVIDTGVDYTHEDLVDNLWRNPGEMGKDANGKDRSTNGIDDDNNGFVDDVLGWDFATNDNKPYDLAKKGFEILMGGNPGHGTHCAGNVACTRR